MPNFQQFGFQKMFRPMWQNTFGPYPSFELNFLSGQGPDGFTFTRASTGTRFLPNGTLTTEAVNIPRLDTNPTTLQPRGLLFEGARTNIALHNRDLTQAAWVKTNCTATRDAIGIDGASNSATTLAATAGNATCLQTVTSASAQRMQSAYIRRVNGTGTVEMTTNGGTTWTALTLTSSWARYTIPAATVTNPQFGFRLVSSGDSIAVDYVQNESSTQAIFTSPILVEGTAATRAEDIGLMNTLSSIGFSGLQGTLFAEFEYIQTGAGTSNTVVNIDNGGTTEIQMRRGGSDPAVWVPIYFVSGTSQTVLDTTPPIVGEQVFKATLAWQLDNFAATINGVLTTDTIGNVTNIHTTMRIGRSRTGGNMNGWLRRLAYYQTRLPDATLQALTV